MVQGVILGENVVGSAEDVEISPPLTKTEQELLNNCLYPSANLGAPSEAVQLVCVDMPNVCNGELNEEVISVKKEEEYWQKTERKGRELSSDSKQTSEDSVRGHPFEIVSSIF